MTTGERLAALSGLSGVTAATMLMAIGTGATAGDRLVDHSGLTSVSAMTHLLEDGGGVQQTEANYVIFARRISRR